MSRTHEVHEIPGDPNAVVGTAVRLRKAVGGVASVSFLVAAVSINLSTFLFHAVVSRALGPAGYGELGPLVNLLQVLSLPLSALQAAVTRSVASSPSGDATHMGLRRVTLQALALSALVDGVIAALAPGVDGYLHFGSSTPVLLVLIWVPASVVGAMWQGTLIARRQYGVVALALFIGNGLVRLLLGVALSHHGGTIAGPVLATSVGAAVTPMLLLGAMRPHLSRASTQIRLNGWALMYVVVSLGGIVVLGNLDAWVARHFLSSHEAGLFTAAVTLGRIPLFLPQALCTLAFPEFVSSRRDGQHERKTLAVTVAATAFFAAVAMAGLAVCGRWLASLVFGPMYTHVASVALILGAANCLIAVATTYTYYQVAAGSRQASIPWIGSAAMFAAVVAFHSSGYAIAMDALASALTVLAADVALLLLPHRSSRPTTLAPIPEVAQ